MICYEEVFIAITGAKNPTQAPKKLLHKLDTSCFHSTIDPKPAPSIPNALPPKYLRRTKKRKDNLRRNLKNKHAPAYLVAVYTCEENFEFEDLQKQVMFCSKKKWIKELPKCVPVIDKTKDTTTGNTSSSPKKMRNKIFYFIETPHTLSDGADDSCGPNRGGCEHDCKIVDEKPECFCFPGFHLLNSTTCEGCLVLEFSP